jgi:acyl-CoA thioesterase
VIGSLYDGSGALVASTSQEALWRFQPTTRRIT